MSFAVSVNVLPKPGIADPQGQTIERALLRQGFDGVEHVRVGKKIEFQLQAGDEMAAEAEVRKACEGFLSNPIIEDFRFSIQAVEA